MERIVEIVDAAEREVLAHHIESTRGLRAYLLQNGGEALLSSLQEEAVRRGLYRYMAVKFTSRLNPQCRELAEAFDPVFRDTTAPQSRGTERQQLSSG